MGEATGIDFFILPVVITDGCLHDPEIQLGSSEQQIEILERIELAEVAPTEIDPRIILPKQLFRCAQPGDGQAEEFVVRKIKRTMAR